MAIDCFICGGDGCRICKKEGWIEILGAGMVHPEILENMGYDPDIYTGFAAGTRRREDRDVALRRRRHPAFLRK